MIATYQAGGKIQPVHAGKDAVVMPARSVSIVQPQGSPHAYVGRSDIKDHRQWDKIATPSFHEALRVAKRSRASGKSRRAAGEREDSCIRQPQDESGPSVGGGE